MSRSERYIAPSAEEIKRREKAAELAGEFDNTRKHLLREALNKRTKADLVELAMRFADEEKGSEWILEEALDLAKPGDLLIHDIGTAIIAATKVDERRAKYDFTYDHRAYDAVHRGLTRLIGKGELESAKRLGMTLMDMGSYQMECSDEGLMLDDIEKCLRPVIDASAHSGGAREWAREMLRLDRIGTICRRELLVLAGETSEP